MLSASACAQADAASLGGLRAAEVLATAYPGPTAPAPAPTLPLLETLAGTGALSSRTAASGHVWVEHSPGFTRPAAGQLSHTPGAYAVASTVVGTGPYTTKLTVTSIGDGGANAGIMAACNADCSTYLRYYVKHTSAKDSYGMTVHTYSLDFSGGGDVLGGIIPPAAVKGSGPASGTLSVTRTATRISAVWSNGTTSLTSFYDLTPAQQAAAAPLNRTGVLIGGTTKTAVVTRIEATG